MYRGQTSVRKGRQGGGGVEIDMNMLVTSKGERIKSYLVPNSAKRNAKRCFGCLCKLQKNEKEPLVKKGMSLLQVSCTCIPAFWEYKSLVNKVIRLTLKDDTIKYLY